MIASPIGNINRGRQISPPAIITDILVIFVCLPWEILLTALS